MPPVHCRSRLLTPADLEVLNERMNDPDVLVRAQGSETTSPADRLAPDNDTLLRKAAGGEAAGEVRRGRFRR